MQKPKGTKDIFGKDIRLRDFVYKTLEEISEVFNFKKIETPIFEKKEIFEHSFGSSSEIVTKEMFHFKDKSDRKMVLRPEGTAGIVRSVVENKLYNFQMPLKFFYLGPMFRYEKPQKGRQRQFHQYGIEIFGQESPYLDAEVILMGITIMEVLKIDYELKINFLGSKQTRNKWFDHLKIYFESHKDKLEIISLYRLKKNVARILDDKIESKKDFVKNAPGISSFYSDQEKQYFQQILSFLKIFNINFSVDYNLVRGFDYYSNVVFEFVSKNEPGAQGTIIGGGRYNDLVHKFGGKNISGIGFAIGIERLINEIKLKKDILNQLEISPVIYVLNIDKSTTSHALAIVHLIRKSGLKTAWNYIPTNINKALEKADKAKAKIKVIIGPKELKEDLITVKTENKQIKVKTNQLIKSLKKIYNEKNGKFSYE